MVGPEDDVELALWIRCLLVDEKLWRCILAAAEIAASTRSDHAVAIWAEDTHIDTNPNTIYFQRTLENVMAIKVSNRKILSTLGIKVANRHDPVTQGGLQLEEQDDRSHRHRRHKKPIPLHRTSSLTFRTRIPPVLVSTVPWTILQF